MLPMLALPAAVDAPAACDPPDDLPAAVSRAASDESAAAATGNGQVRAAFLRYARANVYLWPGELAITQFFFWEYFGCAGL